MGAASSRENVFWIRLPSDSESRVSGAARPRKFEGGVSSNVEMNMNMFTIYILAYNVFSIFCGIISLYSGFAIRMSWVFFTASMISFWMLVRILYSYRVETAVVRLVDLANSGVVAGGIFGVVMYISYGDVAIYMGIMAHIFFYFVYFCSVCGLAMHRSAYMPDTRPLPPQNAPRTV